MTLTVRLDDAIEAALERYCAERGMTKSCVVQESLAAFLFESAGAGKSRKRDRHVSRNLEAFRQAGLIGAGELGGVGADKAAVRRVAIRRIRRALER
jgi:predicted transcriptional regulator